MRNIPAILYIVLFLLVTSQGAYATESELARLADRTIVGLEVHGATVSPEELAAIVPFKEGSPLRPELVRESVLNFYRTGKYDQVEVYLLELSGGVRLRYSLTAKQWLDRITFDGNLYLDDRELLGRIDLRSSEEIKEDKLELNAGRLESYYDFRGFSGTEVTYQVQPGSDNRTAIVFRIKEGDRLFISDIRLTGDPGMSRTKLLTIITSIAGARLDGAKLDNDTERLRNYLRKKMYLVPVINYRVETSGDFTGGKLVIFNIEKGPEFKLEVKVDDDPEGSSRMTKRMKSVFLNTATPEKAKLSIQKIVLEHYREEGYPFTTVDYKEQEDVTGTRSATLEVNKGERVIIGDVKIEGAGFISEEEIRQSLNLEPGAPFVKARMDEGMEKVELQYRREGFLSMTLSRHPLDFTPGEDFQEVTIDLQVQEGTRNLIRSLEITGSPVNEVRAREVLGFREGDPYVPEIISVGRDALLQELGSMGYLYASLTVDEPRIDPDGQVDLMVTVNPGPMVRLRDVIISGNDSVKAKIIRLALNLKRGDVLTQDKILKAQERIYDLKVMSTVDVQLVEPQTPGQNKDLVIKVQERPKYVVGLRGGYGSEDKLRGEVSVTNRNVKGMARSLTLSGRASDIERNTTLLYAHPWFQSLPIDMTASLSDLVEKRESYSRDSLSVAVDFVRALSERTEVRFGYFFEGLRLFDVSPDAQLSPEDEGKTDVAALVAEVLHDARDDFLDPWSGVLTDVILEVAASDLGSKTEYIKTELAARRYVNPLDDIVLAGLLRLGTVIAYGQSEEVIISKRFFLGGQNSVRGYRLDSLGPQDAFGDPVGGNYLVNMNLEMRYPLYKTLRGVVFLDSGSIWLDNASDLENERFHLRYSTGAGLRWSSPIGPLSLDYGYKLNPADFDQDDRYRWHFSIGHAF